MVDAIRQARLRAERANLLGMRNPRLRLEPGDRPDRYRIILEVRGLVAEDGESPRIHEGPWVIEMFFPATYPIGDSPLFLITHPMRVWHPNVKRGPDQWLCLGDVRQQRADVIVCAMAGSLAYQRGFYTLDERLGWNPAAAAWARQHQDDLLPVDPRPFEGNVESRPAE